MLPGVLIFLIIAVLTGCTMEARSLLGETLDPPETVAQVDLQRYAGRWYEIAKLPNAFQSGCVANTTAEYALREDGRIDVVNRCLTDDGEIDQAEGVARVVDPDSNAKLQVSFVQLFDAPVFWGDYWIIGLDEDYRYAIIGTPSRRYGWILSRTPQLAWTTLAQIYTQLRAKGYNPDDFTLTPQTEPPAVEETEDAKPSVKIENKADAEADPS